MSGTAAPNNAITVRAIKQVSPGTVPGSGSMDLLSLGQYNADAPTSRTKTQNISPNGLVADNPATSRSGSGQFGFDRTTWGYRLLQEAVGGAFAAGVLQSTSGIAAAATGNKLVLPSGTWAAGITAGTFVYVVGFASGSGKNGTAFLAKVLSAPSGVNLPIDPAWKTLVDETAGGTVKVYHDGYQDWDRQVNDVLAVEKFNPVSSVGDIAVDVMCTGWTEDFKLDAPVTVTVPFRFSDTQRVTAALSLTTATPAHAAGPVWSSGPNLGDAAHPERGLGFWFDGELLDIMLHGIKREFQNPAKGSRALDSIADVGQYRDDDAPATLEIMVKRDGSAEAESILAAAADVNSVVDIGFGYRDGAGNITYFYHEECQPSGEKNDALSKSGEGEYTITFMLRDGPTYGYCRETVFLPR